MGIVGASWEGEVGEGWVGVEHETGERPEYDGLEQYDHEHDHDREGEGDYDGDGYENEEGYGYEDDGGFNDVLADAILKRPESMRVRSRPKQRDRERPAVPAEFTFPSLSDFGPGVQQGGGGYKQRRDGSVGVQQEEADAGAGIEEMPVLPLALENLADPTPILHKGSSSQLDEESQS
jgi:anthranilate synthase/indole-3-glycerol phosphate synthase/phosphoribosylanthranilate isomerase